MTCVAVTGAAGYIGRVLLPRLEAFPAIERIVALDQKPPSGSMATRKTLFFQQDVRTPSLETLLREHGCTTLIHLAFIVQALHDVRTMYEINVHGSAHVFRSAARAGVHHIINMSSYTVYGARPDNPIPLTEEAPLRPNRGHHYAHHKVAVERIGNQIASLHPQLCITHLRGAVVVGPRCTNSLGKALRGAPFLPVFWRSPSHLQLIHEDDLVEAILAAYRHPVSGPFNVGGRGGLPWGEIVRLAGRRGIPLPAPVWTSIIGLGWYLHLPGTSSPGELGLLRYPLEVDWRKAQRTWGWEPQYTTAQAVLSLVHGNEREPEKR